jgi:hypothetical protein
MKKLLALLLANLLLLPTYSHARDDIGSYSIKDALSLEKAKDRLGNDVKFYFGKQHHGTIAANHGEFKTSKKTNAFKKTDKAACQWAFVSAVLALKNRALREGGNAVVNIRSNYKNHMTTSTTEFRCGAGKIMAGVALIGDVVTLK